MLTSTSFGVHVMQIRLRWWGESPGQPSTVLHPFSFSPVRTAWFPVKCPVEQLNQYLADAVRASAVQLVPAALPWLWPVV